MDGVGEAATYLSGWVYVCVYVFLNVSSVHYGERVCMHVFFACSPSGVQLYLMLHFFIKHIFIH